MVLLGTIIGQTNFGQNSAIFGHNDSSQGLVIQVFDYQYIPLCYEMNGRIVEVKDLLLNMF